MIDYNAQMISKLGQIIDSCPDQTTKDKLQIYGEELWEYLQSAEEQLNGRIHVSLTQADNLEVITSKLKTVESLKTWKPRLRECARLLRGTPIF